MSPQPTTAARTGAVTVRASGLELGHLLLDEGAHLEVVDARATRAPPPPPSRTGPWASVGQRRPFHVLDRGAVTAQVRDPSGHESRCATGQLAVRAGGTKHRQRADRHLLRAVGGDLREQVPDVGVGEPVEQRLPVCGDVLLGQGEVLRGTVPPVLDPTEDLRVHDRVGDGLVPDDRTRIRHDRVSAVEQPQFSRLEGLDVVDEARAGGLPGGPSGGEVAGEHPLGEGLGDDQGGVLDAGQGLRIGQVLVRGPRGDPVDHGRDEGDVRVDPRRRGRDRPAARAR